MMDNQTVRMMTNRATVHLLPYCFGSNKRVTHQMAAPDAATINTVSGNKYDW